MNWVRKNALSAAAQLAAVTVASLALANWVGGHEILRYMVGDYVTPLLVITLLAGGWPWAPPMGDWGRSRITMGSASTALWLATSLPYIAVHYMGGFNPFSSLVPLYTALAWGLGLEAWPLRHLEPWKALTLGLGSTLATAAVANILHPPHYAYGVMLWSMAMLTVASPYFVLQGYPLRRLRRQPRIGAVLIPTTLILSVPLAYLPQGDSLASSIILWSIVYSWSFAYFGIGSRQPVRGVYSLAVVTAASCLWTITLGTAGVDVQLLNLGLILPITVAHNALWLRAPLTKPLLPGMPPPGQVNMEILWEMHY
jgi:hypothetical protein